MMARQVFSPSLTMRCHAAAMEYLVFLVGLCLGSFVTLVSYRLPRGGKMGMTRSQCPRCQTTLGVPDLVPVLSWAASRGRCRHCKAAISWRYPAIELATAGALLAVYFTHGLSGPGLLLMGLSLCLLVMIVVDFEHYIIPDETQWAMALLGIIYQWKYGLHPADMLLGGLIGGGLGWVLQSGYRRLRGREGLGTGDVKFLVVAGLWLGALPLVPFLFFAGVLGVLTSSLWRALGQGELFPFGPALAVSLWLLVLWPVTGEFFFQWPLILFG